MESVAVVVVSLFLSGISGLPLATPPLPPDPIVALGTPDTCLFYFASAGLATPKASSDNLTEQLLAGEDVREFLEQLMVPITRAVQQAMDERPQTTTAITTVVEAAFTRPLAVAVDRFTAPSPNGPHSVVASILLRPGDRTNNGVDAVATLIPQVLHGDAGTELAIAGATMMQSETPLGPLSWGTVMVQGEEETYVITIGEGAVESLLARLTDTDRPVPTWREELEERMPVARCSTFLSLNVAAVLELIQQLPVPNPGKREAVLDATGVAGLEMISARMGMTDEGVCMGLWLGFNDTPRGLFTRSGQAITSKELGRIPADAIMAQTWSVDLSKFLETVFEIVGSVEPNDADAMRNGLDAFRAAAGFDIDTHLLKTLGPDWTILSVPTRGGILPGVAVIAGVRDRPTFATVHKVLISLLQAATGNAEVQLSVRQLPYRRHTLFCLDATGEKFAIPLTPTWCLTEDSLIVTMSPQFMKTLLWREAADPGIGGLPAVTKVLAGNKPVLVGGTDPAWVVGSLFGLYELGAPIARGVLREKGIELDLPHLPAASAIMPYVRPSVRAITVAMLTAMEEAADKRLPSQAICDKDGKPLLSWRVALLPYLGQRELYEEFRLDEPWDSEHNRRLLGRIPSVYVTPGGPVDHAREGRTTIQVLSGPETVFQKPSEALSLEDVTDGSSRTLVLVEALPENAVPWTKPADGEVLGAP